MPTLRSQQKVFLNFPYSKSYEEVFLGTVCALVTLGRMPVVTFELPDHGQGRLKRIWTLLCGCAVSIHDLSAVGVPVRFNMPFELGMACGLQRALPRENHRFFVFEAEKHRLDLTTTDLKGIDPRIHNGCATGSISAVLAVLGSSNQEIAADDVVWIYRRVKRILPKLRRRHHTQSLYHSGMLNDIVEAVLVLSELRFRK